MVTYFLQPFNSPQSWSPNWYNVNYRRTGTYKGFGGLGQGIDPNEAASLATQAGILPGAGTSGPYSLSDVVSSTSNLSLASACNTVNGGYTCDFNAPVMTYGSSPSSTPGTTLPGWVVPVAIGGGVLLLLMVIKGGRR